MTIRIPDFLFARSSGETGELDYETRSALEALRSTEKEMTALNRGLGLAGEALKSGEKVQERLLAAGKALGAQGNGGALRWLLDHVAAERARQEAAASRRSALRTLTGTLKGVGSLPIPFARKAELGRALLRRAVERGLVVPREQELFEAAALSQFGLIEAQSAIAKAVEPGEAPAIVAAAKAEGGLLPVDAALLDRQALERDAVASARHRGRLAWKEQDDLAAFARGELPEPLSEESFRIIHGAAAAAGAQARYDTARREGEALALIRGKDTDAIEAAQAAWQGDPAVFAAAVAKDQAERRRDPAGYALATVPGTAAAMEETPEAERGALLWAAQAAAGIPEDQRSPWTLAQEEAMADVWDALPAGSAGRDGKLAFFRKHLLRLPMSLRDSAIGRMVRQGITDGTKAELSGVVASLDEGRFNAARRLASNLQAAKLTTGEQHIDSGQIADDSSDLPQVAQGFDATEDAKPGKQGTSDNQPLPHVAREIEALRLDQMTEERKAAVPATMAALNARLAYAPGQNTVDDALPDREAMLDVLRASYVLFRDTKNNVGVVMPGELVSAVRNIYGALHVSDPALPDEQRLRETAFEAIMTDETLFEIPERLRSQPGETMEKFRDHLARWNKLNDEERLELLRHVAMVVAGIYGLGDFDVEVGKLSSYGTSALWKGSQSGNAADVMLVDFSDEDPKGGGLHQLARLDDLFHELGHAYQEKLIRRFRAGEITPDDEHYQQVELFVLSQAYYNGVTAPLRSIPEYFNDPREGHAEANKRAWQRYRLQP